MLIQGCLKVTFHSDGKQEEVTLRTKGDYVAFGREPTSACGAPLWMKIGGAGRFVEPARRAIVLRLTKLRWLATPIGSPARAA